jgi:hypothetical protein
MQAICSDGLGGWKHESFRRAKEEHDRARQDYERAQRALCSPLLRVGKLRAVTPPGIFAKALVVQKVGTTAATALGRSLARDLLACSDLRKAIWPAGAKE